MTTSLSSLFDQAYIIGEEYGDVLAVIPTGSDLYNTKIDNHDHDFVVIIKGNTSRQVFIDDLDVKICSYGALSKGNIKGSLQEVESVLAIRHGYAQLHGSTGRFLLPTITPNIGGYLSTMDRYLKNKDVKDKHSIRHDIFKRRYWETGNADPRLTEEERQEWLTRTNNL